MDESKNESSGGFLTPDGRKPIVELPQGKAALSIAFEGIPADSPGTLQSITVVTKQFPCFVNLKVHGEDAVCKTSGFLLTREQALSFARRIGEIFGPLL